MRPVESGWYLQEWCAQSAPARTQADFMRALGLGKNTAFKLWHGTQPYNQEYVNQAAAWLQIRPYELLLPPAEAMGIRRMRESALQIVGGAAAPEPAPAAPQRAAGRR